MHIFKINSNFCSMPVPVHEKQENSVKIFEGVNVESPRAHLMLKSACQTKFCPECTLGLDIKHTDVLILSQYVRSDGCMLPRRITGLCHRQQKKMGTLVTMAQKAGLMPNLAPEWSKEIPRSASAGASSTSTSWSPQLNTSVKYNKCC